MNLTLYLVLFIYLILHISHAVAEPTCNGKFHPYTKDLRQGRLLVDIKNPTETTHEYSHFLTCPTLTVIAQPRQHITIAGGETRALKYILGFSKSQAKEHPDAFEHTCVLKRWRRSSDVSSPITCKIIVRTYPGGYFLRKCESYEGKDLIILPSKDDAEVRVKHSGDIAHYVANISCTPKIGFAHAEKMYNHLQNDGIWDIQLAPNCSNAIADLDYSGICRLSIFHLCQEQALVAEYRYPYFEGNVDECVAEKTKTQERQQKDDLNNRLQTAAIVFLWAIIFFIISIIIRANVEMMVNREFEDDANIPQKSDFIKATLSICCFPKIKHFSERIKEISEKARLKIERGRKLRQEENAGLLENEE